MPDCVICDGLGVVFDPDWCGDEEHCAPANPCSVCNGTGKERESDDV